MKVEKIRVESKYGNRVEEDEVPIFEEVEEAVEFLGEEKVLKIINKSVRADKINSLRFKVNKIPTVNKVVKERILGIQDKEVRKIVMDQLGITEEMLMGK